MLEAVVDKLAELRHAFWRVLKPTGAQVLGALLLAAGVLVAAQSQAVLQRLGITDQAIELARRDTLEHVGAILTAPLVAHIALVTFWAAVGLVAYLLCWGAYNAWITARNQVTIETQYTNKGHWQGVVETLALKAVAALALAVYLATFQYGLALWVTLAAGLSGPPSAGAIVAALVAVLGLALELYGLLVLVQLVITPWYRVKAFTDDEK